MSFLIHRISAAQTPLSPRVGALDRGFQLGDGVFDTMTAAPKAWQADRHISRLVAHAAAIGILVSRDRTEVMQAEVLAELDGRPAIIRTTVTRGQAARALWPAEVPEPTLLVTAQPYDLRLIGAPARLVVATAPRNQRSVLSGLKSLAYLDNILAAREAADAGTDDALILNLDGHAACSTIANVFALQGRRLVTPPLSDGCLDGIVRAVVLAEAAGLGLEAAETSLTPADLNASDAVFLTNSVRLLRPVRKIGDADIPASPLVDRILDQLRAALEQANAAS